MSFERVGNKSFSVGESPRWHCEQKKLWFTDVPEQKLNVYDPLCDEFAELFIGKNVSGFCFNKDGRIVCATHTGVYLADKDGRVELVAKAKDGHYLKCNDCTADAKGRFLFGTSFYDPGINHGDLGNLYVMNCDRSIIKVDDGIIHSNGMAFSPDQKLFYYTDCAARKIYVYDYDLESGIPKNRREFVNIPRYEGIPDGMAVDAEGYVWSAQWYGGVVVRYKPDGNIDFVMRTPAQQTSAIAFGGDDLCDIYVTSAQRWAYLDDIPINYEYDVLPPGGGLYRFNYGIKGTSVHFADIK
ncbi:MAG TPA: SMP-30/gluconolactonase/LRE family protein [Christensenellaceae bacterium]|nr:SMP-30/gluconolactonase/LRE family protein [Christensenellaceae bacterium]